jgi:hypothetical protein
MNDHVARMVYGWLDKTMPERVDASSALPLIDAIHRLIREAEDDTRRRYADAAETRGRGSSENPVIQAVRALEAERSADSGVRSRS